MATRISFEQLLRPQLQALYRTAFRMTGNVDTARDAVQDACLKAYEGFDRFDPGSNFRAWIFRILTNTIFDMSRRQSRSPFVALDNEQFENAIQSQSDKFLSGSQPELRLVRKTFLGDASQAMADLPDDIRIVVSLALLDEMSYAEIAEVLNCPVGTVRSRLSRGREKMRDSLAKYATNGSLSDDPLGDRHAL